MLFEEHHLPSDDRVIDRLKPITFSGLKHGHSVMNVRWLQFAPSHILSVSILIECRSIRSRTYYYAPSKYFSEIKMKHEVPFAAYHVGLLKEEGSE